MRMRTTKGRLFPKENLVSEERIAEVNLRGFVYLTTNPAQKLCSLHIPAKLFTCAFHLWPIIKNKRHSQAFKWISEDRAVMFWTEKMMQTGQSGDGWTWLPSSPNLPGPVQVTTASTRAFQVPLSLFSCIVRSGWKISSSRCQEKPWDCLSNPKGPPSKVRRTLGDCKETAVSDTCEPCEPLSRGSGCYPKDPLKS